MAHFDIPFTKAYISPNELDNASKAIQSRQLQGDGPLTKSVENKLQELTKSPRVLLTSSCTDALEMAMLLADINPGDEVIMPSFTFVSTANAVALRQAKSVFVDIEAATLNLDLSQVEAAITPRTKAVIPVHYAGISCDMDRLGQICKSHNILMIEDAAHGIGARFGDAPLGSIGDLGALSFHQTKNITCGEGGALLLNNSQFIDRAEIMREKGTNRRQFLRGEVDKYTWVDIGSSFLPSELNAAILLSQLEQCQPITNRRASIFSRYLDELKPLASKGYFSLPSIPAKNSVNGHIFYLVTKSFEDRESLRRHLLKNGIKTTSHYEPLHLAPAARKYGCLGSGLKSLPVTEKISQSILRLPIYMDLTPQEQDFVIASVNDFFLH